MPNKGLLQVTGTIDLAQFWPPNKSDGDTVKVTVDPDGFKFATDGHAVSLKETHVFDEAFVLGSGWGKAVSKGKITVRLEHIDAPELHYEGTKNFRQYFGETATTKLHDLLATAGKQPIPCEVRTFIDHPNEVFDTYGRLIGNIIIKVHNKEVNVNHWLVQNGWAFPTFYNSALDEEIKEVSKYAEEARKAKKGIWAHFSEDVGHPDFSLEFRPGGPANPEADIGPVVIPKMFRREVAWQKAQVSGYKGEFRDYLAKQKEDGWVKTADFLHNHEVKPANTNMATLVNKLGMFEALPGDLVFFEKESILARSVDAWWPPFETMKPVKKAA